MLRPLWISLLIYLLGSGAVSAREELDDRPLRLGVLSYAMHEPVEGHLEAVMAAINEQLGERSLMLLYMTAEEMDEALRFNQLEFVLTDPRHALLLRATNSLSGAIATLAHRIDDDLLYSFGGVIFARIDRADITALDSPAIQSVAFLGTELLGSYQAQLYEFAQRGVKLQQRATFLRQPNTRAVVEAVLAGRADVGFLRSGELEVLQGMEAVNIDGLRVLNPQQLPGFPHRISTRLYPEMAVLALPGVDTQTNRDIAAALLSYHHGSVIEFVPPANYSAVELTARELDLAPFDVERPISLRQLWQQQQLNVLLALTSFLLLLVSVVITVLKNAQLRQQSENLSALNITLEQRVKDRVKDVSSVFNASPDAIVQVNARGVITWVNQRAELMSGYRSEELLGQPVEILVPPVARGRHPQLFNQYMKGERNQQLDSTRVNLRLHTKHGREIPVDIRLANVESVSGISVIASIRDISVFRELESSLVKAKEEAERASQKKAEFLANMSHEIRTPMNGVLGMAQLLEDANLEPKYRGYLETLEQSGRTLLTVINDILDYSKISEGKLEFEHVAFNLRQWVEALTLPYRLTQHRVGMVVDIDRDVPELIRGDATRLSQVFNNLLSNAFKFTERGSVSFRIAVADRLSNSVRLEFEVVDTGIGIPDHLKDKIFEKFEQADPSTTRKYGGTGLGLAIAKQLVELSGGAIAVADNPGGGTVFRVAQSFAIAEPVSSAAVDGQESSRLHTLRVLLAEDNPVNQQVARAMLGKLGVECQIVGDGLQALECIQTSTLHFDCIFMDCEMPRMDGYETTRRIRAWEQQTGRRRMVICALTAHAIGDQVQQCLDAGMDEHLAKPLQTEKLEQFLHVLAQRARNG